MTFLLVLALLFPQPTDADLDELGAILCGEACGMPVDALEFVGRQLWHDWFRLGTHGMDGRWYGYKPNDAAVEVMRGIFDEALPLDEPLLAEWCRLVGNVHDVPFWVEHGYLAPDAVPDYHWEHKGMEISAFDCTPREVTVRRWVECLERECPR